MLLLVLILVLIAFGLLVVALLSGSVLWAWVSVGVSVAAAAVLLVDWLQRRSAVQAGAEAAGAGADAPRRTMPDAEPVTEILPVIPRSGAAPGADDSINGAPQEAADARFEQAVDGQQTVVMPIVQPPASADRPSGASRGTTPSGGDSSQTVTTAGAGRSSSTPPSGDAGETVEVAGAGVSSPAKDGPAKPDLSKGKGAHRPAGEPSDGETLKVENRREKTGDRAEVAGAAAAQEPKGSDAEETVTVDAMPGTTGAASPADAAPAESAPADAAPPPGADADADAEPPEEPHDPAAAGLVATLDVEVVVIDEQPRYHVTECRSLAGKALIPLPVREAVELGFTPCGWCSPDRTLAGRQTAPR